ncbi:hypothetical protein BH11VER1_BH11VER1_02040 [soil metagenome]
MSITANNIDQAELSKRYQEALVGQRLITLLFTTFSFDSGFFEQEILRIFFDLDLSHSRELRLVKLEDALRDLRTRPAVYYDARALTYSDVGAACLDIARHPIRLNGCFHPKIICALTETLEPDETTGHRARRLIVGCQSANLTRPGWWENVECCHIEKIDEFSKSGLAEPLRNFLKWLIKRSQGDSRAADEILGFLKDITPYKRLARQLLSPRFLCTDMTANGRSITDMLFDEAGTELCRMNLEIISPYFNEDDGNSPLDSLVERFEPKELRVFLPRDEEHRALVSQRVYKKHHGLWGSLPDELLRNGSGKRFVHAKVYRFFSSSPKRELWFVGSVNLTREAHQPGGNMECGFLVERDLQGIPRPTFLIEPDTRKPTEFTPNKDPLEDGEAVLTNLTLRYNWSTQQAEALWARKNTSPRLKLASSGIEIGVIEPLMSNHWIPLSKDIASQLAMRLAVSSLVDVIDENGGSAQILVMEEGMTHKATLLHSLSAADILRYWSMLTPEQRGAFLEDSLGMLLLNAAPDDLILKGAPLAKTDDSLFDRFAGFFHAFHTLEKSVREAIGDGRLTHAVARLFGKKHDSLGHLLARLESADDPINDGIDRYVITMCAKQSLEYLRGQEPKFWAEHKTDARALLERVNSLQLALRTKLALTLDAEFIHWFEKEFLRRETVQPSTENIDANC